MTGGFTLSTAYTAKPNSLLVRDQRVAATKWSLTQNGFDNLLRHLHPNREIAGEIYEETRRKLVRFFAARGAELSDSLADQTLDRVARRFEDGIVVPNFQSYCFGVARLLHLETHRKQKFERTALCELARISRTDSTENSSSQEVLECLERLMDELPAKERHLISAYYGGGDGEAIKTRQRLADQLGIDANAVRIRVHRIRRKLEARFLSEQFIDYQCWSSLPPAKATTFRRKSRHAPVPPNAGSDAGLSFAATM
jgi:RNA polymerase sigma factor (sigma-70 family)